MTFPALSRNFKGGTFITSLVSLGGGGKGWFGVTSKGLNGFALGVKTGFCTGFCTGGGGFCTCTGAGFFDLKNFEGALGAAGGGAVAVVTAEGCTIGSNSLSKFEEVVFFDLKNFFGLEIDSEPGLIIGAFLMEVKEA